MSDAGLNWMDVDVMSDVGINWAGIRNISEMQVSIGAMSVL